MRKTRLLSAAAVVAALAALQLGAASAGTAKSTGTLPLGKYRCYQFSSSVGFLYWGYFKLLSPSTYRDASAGPGRYAYSSATQKIAWLSGPYRRYRYKGEYQPKGTNGHKSNTIVLLGPESVKIECQLSR
jgi:hypothetical protein